MKRNKFYSGIATALLASTVALTGCSFGADDNSGSSDDNASGDAVTVDVFQFKVEFKEQFEELVSMYEEENPDVNINVKTVGGGNDYGASLKTSFSSGEEPDVFNVGGPTDVDEYENYLADLSDTKAADAALEGTLSGVSRDDKVLGLPFNQEGYGLLYNKKVFEEAGINPEEITTFEALEEAVQTLEEQKSELGIEAPFAFPAKEKWVIGNHLANAYLADEFNHDVMEAYEADTVEFTMGEDMKRFIDLQNEYSVQPTLSLDYSQQVEENFSLGKVAMIQQGNWVYNTIESMDPEFAENNVGLLPIPVEGYEGSIPVGVPNYWVVNKKSDDEVVQASKDFLDWMYTSEEGKKFVTEEFKFIPAYEGYEDQEIADPISQEIYDYASEGNTLGWVFLGAPTGWTEDAFGVAVQEYLAGDISWEEVEKRATKNWENSRQ
ncbi:raffinose/stachyose/melibiose transport system substrate-binding protein [Halobacillus karajensis]|uniref:Multiple sugar-binding protein n=1 Tax=Halobacillus karajensis TaxID=195088 RepID=A0A024P322_9BACI|nr:ABC transporter substrate-binding protein [Halobacillus karajensis]CDQ18863.1 Multiple sugar-binding protein precursor [Halobacillus karajensis]CDQ23064.1 Multiple sugar-binding protein precursor [Halobacillus karajensis]CDQ26546.1 Multiple sugar-binding protein precursor [Halobacillus karajensis]SEH45082.1 raffinose/stachyose/melibiose transport system substrate-binding protein [Halobacillus karajensis]